MPPMMRRILHHVLIALVALSFVISGQAIAQAKGASPATGQMVLCTGTGPVVIYTDAEGQPTAPPHICPDCALAMMTGLTPLAQLPVRVDHPAYRLNWPTIAGVARSACIAHIKARAPPASV